MVCVCNKAEEINHFIIDHNLDLLALTKKWLSGTITDDPVIGALLPNGYTVVPARSVPPRSDFPPYTTILCLH
jgi:hypothetical protein